MITGISQLYRYQATYCVLKVAYDECKWWQFQEKLEIISHLYWFYPLMKNEVKSMAKATNTKDEL